MIMHRKSYSTADTREEAMAAFRAEYEKWLREAGKELMTESNSFKDARIGFGGRLSGADEKPHSLFKIERTEGPVLYGEYVFAVAEDRNHFNVETGPFGYIDRYCAGLVGPSIQQHFSAEECSTLEQLIRAFFSTPGVFDKSFIPRELFLGGISFRPNWIIRED
jgi:hypothetical protein